MRSITAWGCVSRPSTFRLNPKGHAMRWCYLLMLVCLVGCTHETPPAPVPPPPEDLSTWSVPELVQPPAPEAAVSTPEPGSETATPGTKVYPFTPGTTFAVTVPVGWPLDLVLERGEQVRNLI